MVYHQDLGNTHNLYLNTTDSSQDDSHAFNDTSPTSTVFTLGISGFIHAASGDYIAFIFSEVPGFSKFSSYIGNGSSSDGTFVYTGFRPAYLMMKSSSHTSHWSIYDNQRDPDNVIRNVQYTNLTIGDGVGDLLDFTANGFKLRTNSTNRNGSGRTYFYYAFAESPFKNARAR